MTNFSSNDSAKDADDQLNILQKKLNHVYLTPLGIQRRFI